MVGCLVLETLEEGLLYLTEEVGNYTNWDGLLPLAWALKHSIDARREEHTAERGLNMLPLE